MKNSQSTSPPRTTAKASSTKAGLSQLLGRISPYFVRHKRRLLAGFAALLTVDAMQLTIPRILKRGVDLLATASASPAILLRYGLFIILLALSIIALRFIWRTAIIGFSRLLERGLRDSIFSHLLKMDITFFEKRTTGDIMAHASNDLSAIQMACGMGMVAAVDALVMSLAAVGFMLHINIQLTVLALLPMPLLAVCTRVLSGKLHTRFNTVQEQFSLLTEFSRSTLVSIRLIKAYTMESFQTRRFAQLGEKYVRSNLRVARIQGLMFPIATLTGNIGMLCVVYYGGLLVIREAITLGDFVAFMTYLYMLIWPMMAVGWVTNLVQRGLTSLRRIHSLLSATSSLPDIEAPAHPVITDTPVFRLNKLCFSYPSARHAALRNITLEFGPGIHGVTGRTGSGKSTLCKILTRLCPVEDNQLSFDGTDVNVLPLATIRAHIGYVSQEPVLFSDSITANIRLGCPDAGRAQIEDAARLAAIHDDILTLPQGYETIIGEKGVKLSGGQRQRLALARALITDRPVLVIDDGLSAVDVTTEQEILSGFRQQMKNKTVLIVSNRIKLLSMTDRTIILENGVVRHSGNHHELLQHSSFYQAMYEKQTREQEVGKGQAQ